LATILKLVSTFSSCIPFGGKTLDKLVNKRMSNYGDVFQVQKSRLVRPDFKHKFVNKQLTIKSSKTINEEEDILIYMEDASSSMERGTGYHINKAIQLLLGRTDMTVHYYRYWGEQYEFYNLNKENKVEIFNAPKNYYMGKCNYYKLFKEVLNKYSNKHIIISTDGEDYFPQPHVLDINNTLHVVNYRRNLNLESFTKKTGGNYLIV